MNNLAPVALFVYNRLANTKKTIEHLQRNFLANETDLFIFSDGGKDAKSWKEVNQVRQLIQKVTGFKSVTIVEREKNFYLERNIMEGIAEIFQQYDKIIVVEDDILTSPFFLTYMNEALDHYQNEQKVMHIAGYTNVDALEEGDTYYTRMMFGWGWATWRNRWQKFFQYFYTKEEALSGMTEQDCDTIQYGGVYKCLKYLDYNPIPWDICWKLAIYKADGLCLTPTHTLVRNCGIYGGTHFKNMRIFGSYIGDREPSIRKINVVNNNICLNHNVELKQRDALVDHGMRYNLLGKMVRPVYLKFFKRSKRNINLK